MSRHAAPARRPVLVPAGLALGGLAAALLGGPVAAAAPAPAALATTTPVAPPPGPPPTAAPVPVAVLPRATGTRASALPDPALDIWPRGLLAQSTWT